MTSPGRSGEGHTPRPWSVIDNSWEVSTVYGPDGEIVAECPISGDATEETQFEHEAVKEANASLIARAVNFHEELLAALEGDIDWIDALSQMTIERDTALVRIRAHRALIAKATGKATP